MIALDLFAALMVADLPNRCMIVLATHLVESYGPLKHREVILDATEIEHVTNLHRNNVRRGIKELVAANILIPRGGGAYKFNKDFETWTPGGKPLSERLAGGATGFAKWAKEKFRIRENKSASDPIQRDSEKAEKPINDQANVAIPLDCENGLNPNPVGLTPNPVGLRSEPQPQSLGIGSNAYASDASITRETSNGLAGAHAPGDLEREDSPLSPCSPPGRSLADNSQINAAIRILEANRMTTKLAAFLADLHGTSGPDCVAGWQWLAAARKIQSPRYNDGQKQSWQYFYGMAKTMTGDEVGLQAEPAPVKESFSERRRRERSEAFKRRAETADTEADTDG